MKQTPKVIEAFASLESMSSLYDSAYQNKRTAEDDLRDVENRMKEYVAPLAKWAQKVAAEGCTRLAAKTHGADVRWGTYIEVEPIAGLSFGARVVKASPTVEFRIDAYGMSAKWYTPVKSDDQLEEVSIAFGEMVALMSVAHAKKLGTYLEEVGGPAP
jgi:hypothetical protein